tara:strand:- start:36 stop:419 length:384 start_codon:yes stop_codon:yes gene_type:complete
MKERTLNEYRQTKEYKLNRLEKAHKIPEEIEKIQEELEYKDVEFNDLDQKDLIEEAKEMITNKIIKHFDDVLFEMVCKEMSKNYLFKESNYLTVAGMDEFEDAWFEFYHEHHGDILYRIKHNLSDTN